MVARTANSADPEKTASSEAVFSGSALFVQSFFGRKFSVQNFTTFVNIFLSVFTYVLGAHKNSFRWCF